LVDCRTEHHSAKHTAAGSVLDDAIKTQNVRVTYVSGFAVFCPLPVV
jgi:hypothetical protein